MVNRGRRLAHARPPPPHRDLVAKLVAMAIDSGAVPWNQWTPETRKCLIVVLVDRMDAERRHS